MDPYINYSLHLHTTPETVVTLRYNNLQSAHDFVTKKLQELQNLEAELKRAMKAQESFKYNPEVSLPDQIRNFSKDYHTSLDLAMFVVRQAKSKYEIRQALSNY